MNIGIFLSGTDPPHPPPPPQTKVFKLKLLYYDSLKFLEINVNNTIPVINVYQHFIYKIYLHLVWFSCK